MQGGERPTTEFDVLRNRRVLIVDDQQEIHQDFIEMLRDSRDQLASNDVAGYLPSRSPSPRPQFELLHVTGGEAACELVGEARRSGRPVAAAYVDIRMPPGVDGIETVRRMRTLDRDIEIVLMTAYSDQPLSEVGRDLELPHKLLYIRKPFAREEIRQITLSLVQKWNIERELEEGRRQLAESHGRLEAVLNATGNAIAMYDDAGRLVFANQWYEQLLGAPSDALRAMPRDAAMQRFTERRRSVLEVPRGVGADGGEGSVVELGRSRREQVLFYRSRQAVRDEAGDVIGELFVYRDLSREIEVAQMKLEVERLQADLETTYAFSGIVGSSVGIRDVCSLVRRVANSEVTVLVRGETGTGKELIGRALHFNGPRRKGPFVAVNLAAVPETLAESELFGHERGAFTGATARRTGCFERASGGTLLLDEIGDMPVALQAKLLRVLEERRICRIGGSAAIPVDVRVVAATNRDLEAALRDGAFREDLYYRIAVFPIEIPPLRTRLEDIPLLAAHFVEKHAAKLGRSVRSISAAAEMELLRYPWPGNVRELENVICRALVLETTDVLQKDNLPADLWQRAAPPSEPAPVVPLAEVERRAIANALEQSGRNLTQTAKALGISRGTLHRKLKEYGQGL